MTNRWVLLALLLSTGSSSAFSQVNLVVNGDFETYSRCPSKADQIMLAKGWTPLDTVTKNTDTSGNSECSAEYINACGNIQWTVPRNYCGYQYPHSGNGMAVGCMYVDGDTNSFNHYMRDYMMGRLTQKLTAGKRYCVSFYVVLAEVSIYAIKEIGAYLDNGAIAATNYCGIPQSQYTPQVVNTAGIITDTLNWTKIEGSFIANGTEKYITIGNFKDRTHTTNTTVPWGKGNVAYYFVDDVSVVESNSKANAGPDTHVGTGDSVFIGYHDMALDAYWTVLGSSTVIGKGAGMWVKPSVTTSYVVTQTLCGIVTKDTVKVEVWKAGVTSVKGQTQQYSIVPNPNNGVFEIAQLVATNEQVVVYLTNAVGQRVYASDIQFRAGKASMTVQHLPPGLYYLSLKTKAGYLWNMRCIKQ